MKVKNCKKEKGKIYIWGTGRVAERFYGSLRWEEWELCGAIDSDKKKEGLLWKNKILVYSPEHLIDAEYDYVFVMVKEYTAILKQYSSMNLDKQKIICMYDESDDRVDSIYCRELEDYIKEIGREIYILQLKAENAPYELGCRRTPKIKSMVELLERAIEEKLSVCRFGDGELELMANRARPWFQKVDERLANRLKQVFNCKRENPLIALSNNFGSLSMYTEEAALGIRNYLKSVGRENVSSMIDFDREYYDAYISRPYLMFKDKSVADTVFQLYKKLWNKRDILLVEGQYMRTGINNDLFAAANSVRRILCPAKNAFDYYNTIYDCIVRNVYEDDLVLIALGPTATVLAYDICILGYQAIDLGQIDNEYEWYLMKADDRVAIEGKAVPELSGQHSVHECDDLEYNKQVIEKIGFI